MAQSKKASTHARRSKSSSSKPKPTGRALKDLGERTAGKIKGGVTVPPSTTLPPRIPRLPGAPSVPCV